MNKKTATITWIKYNNYGTFLQAYGLQKTLETNGVNNVILDDININSEVKANENSIQKDRNILLEKAYKLLFLNNTLLEKKYKKINSDRNEQFAEFKKKYLKISEPVDNKNLSKLNNEYDAFICGSDQIWAPKDEIFNEYYYLGFASDEKLKISYAPSIGLNVIPDNKKEKISRLINRLDNISVREEQGAQLLRALTSKEIEVVLDPTLLLNSAQWSSIIPKSNNKEPYILCYFLGDKQWYREYFKKFSKNTGLKVIVLPMYFMDLKLGDCSEAQSGPADFIRLFRDAEYIFTDSFHGTIFSTLFNKKFITFKRFDKSDKNCQNSRIYNLLDKVNLLDRFIGDEGINIEVIKKEINYDDINKILEGERKKSLDFLFKALDKIRT